MSSARDVGPPRAIACCFVYQAFFAVHQRMINTAVPVIMVLVVGLWGASTFMKPLAHQVERCAMHQVRTLCSFTAPFSRPVVCRPAEFQRKERREGDCSDSFHGRHRAKTHDELSRNQLDWQCVDCTAAQWLAYFAVPDTCISRTPCPFSFRGRCTAWM